MVHTISSGSSFIICLELNDWHISMGYHSGDCSDDIQRLMVLPEIKTQLDNISDEELNRWWNDFYIDNEVEHKNATRETKLEWLLFDCCALGIDGCFEE